MRSPIVIGGLGGSGTRLVRSLVLRSGAHMGRLVSRIGRWRSLDAARAAQSTETMRDGLTRFGYLP